MFNLNSEENLHQYLLEKKIYRIYDSGKKVWLLNLDQ